MEILIVKLGALGDVLRTTPLLTALKAKYPGSRIQWVVDKDCASVLEQNLLIDELTRYDASVAAKLSQKRFDLAVNLDKEPEALDAITAANADKKMGFGRTPDGALGPLDAHSDYAYRLGIDDELKFRTNRKSYQMISFEQLGLTFGGEEYLFSTVASDDRFARELLTEKKVALGDPSRPVIGLNTGSGHRFAGKKLPIETLCALAERLTDTLGAQVLLLGGQSEVPLNAEIERRAKSPLVNTGSHSLSRFASIVKLCDLVVSGDTTAMHIAIAVKTPVVVYFGSTSAPEIELYGRGAKIVAAIDCAPCYKKTCPIGEECMKLIGADRLFQSARSLLGTKASA
jgi:heptosyltransferase-2